MPVQDSTFRGQECRQLIMGTEEMETYTFEPKWNEEKSSQTENILKIFS